MRERLTAHESHGLEAIAPRPMTNSAKHIIERYPPINGRELTIFSESCCNDSGIGTHCGRLPRARDEMSTTLSLYDKGHLLSFKDGHFLLESF